MKTKEDRGKALKQYAAIMREIKMRLSAVEAAMNGETRLHRMFAQEFCFLQLRMICELVALGCLSAQGDIATNKIKKEWSADTILKALESLEKHFFPWPTKQTHKDGRTQMSDDDRPNCITKEGLLELYGTCGNYVHRGTYRNIFDVKRSRVVEFQVIQDHLQSIIDLLHGHSIVIQREDRLYMMFFILAALPDGNVKGMIAAELDPLPPIPKPASA